MNVYTTEFDGVVLIEPNVYNDSRGSFQETWNWEQYNLICRKLLNPFVQDNESFSGLGVCRGMHWQTWPMAQSKLVRCVKGKIIDIVLCLIKNSPDFGKYIAFELSGENKRQLFIPRGYAHGFVTLDDENIVNYKVDNFYSPMHERCLRFENINLNALNIPNLENLPLNCSKKDTEGLLFNELKEEDLFIYSEQELNEVLKNKGIDPTAYKESLNNPEVKTATEVEEESIKSEEE